MGVVRWRGGSGKVERWGWYGERWGGKVERWEWYGG